MNEKEIARGLLEIGAVKLSPEEPFTWASGLHSPIYCDNRKALSSPTLRSEICKTMVEIIKARYPKVEIIAGVATGAIAYGAIVADILGLPFCYVRSAAKDHGMGNQVEGKVPEGSNVVIIEDLISTGGSSIAAAEALMKIGAHILGMVAIFSYNFHTARGRFESSNLELITLSNYDALIDEAISGGDISPKDEDMLREWRFSPEQWSEKHQ
ncbi:MAG: orotate phosphoribosyltransferase [Bacteroidales bacterium]|mgnify:FL=1|nr:orotate phosphoribosyltransferase [Bacteroidales bacterium]